MDESTKLRMNLMAIQKVDPYAKEILDSCPHVAFYKYVSNEWQKSEIEGSFFVYSRVAEPFHSIFINNRLNTNSLVEPITKPIELQSQPPFLLYRNQRQAISGFWFYCKEDCVRIHALLEKLIKKCGGGSVNPVQHHSAKPEQQQQQQPPPHQPQAVNVLQNLTNGSGGGGSGGTRQEVDIFSMLTKAQAEFKHSNGPVFVPVEFAEMKINHQQQPPPHPSNHHQPLMKQLSSAMPDITSPNVVSFFAAAQQPNGVAAIEGGGHPHAAAHFASSASNPKVAPVQTLDEIEKQHRVSSISPKMAEPKLLNNLLQSAAAANATQSQNLRPILGGGGGTSKPTLITPAMFQAPPSSSSEDKAPVATPVNHYRPEPLTQNQLIQALNYLLETDPDFIQKIHEAYIKSFRKISN